MSIPTRAEWRAFWRDVRAYYSPAAIAARLDRLAERLRSGHE